MGQELLLNFFQIAIGPVALGFLVWCYYKVQHDPELKAPAKMSLDILESEKPPGDWENLEDFEESTQNEEEDDEDEEDAEETPEQTPAATNSNNQGPSHSHSHSHNQ